MIYIDSSALLRFLLQHSNFINLVEYNDDFVSSELLKLECQRALIRYRLNQEVGDEGLLQLSEHPRLDTTSLMRTCPSLAAMILRASWSSKMGKNLCVF